MKKTLLIAAAFVLTVVNINAQDPKEYPGYGFAGLSSTGKYAVSSVYGNLSIVNLTTGMSYDYSELEGYSYNIGGGNCISDNGVVVGQESFVMACYWKNGQWYNFDASFDRNQSIAHGVTPDGKRIVGAVAPENYGGDFEGMMLQPCYWDEQDDGTYGEVKLLPFPDKDLTGRTPQYVTAVSVSDDGKTIAGQIQDYGGNIAQPIVYRLQDDGTWIYDLPQNELYHPEGFVLPEDPGDLEVSQPSQEEFMSEEELVAYLAAVDAWYAEGTWDYSTYPEYGDFMTADEIAAYQAAYDAYMAIASEWEEKWLAFSTAYQELGTMVPAITFNNVLLSSDGKIYATTAQTQVDDPMAWFPTYEYNPFVFNLENDTYKTYSNADVSLITSSIANNGTLLAQQPAGDFPAADAYILPAGAELFVKLYDYMTSNYPAIGEWMKENMTHEYISYDYEWDETIGDYNELTSKEELLLTGIPFMSADMSVIATAVMNYWYDWDTGTGDDYVDTYGYVFPLGASAGIDSAMVRGSGIKVQNGKLVFGDDVKSATIYNMSGAQVFATSATGSSISTGLNAGIYLVKVVAADGTVSTVKVAF